MNEAFETYAAACKMAFKRQPGIDIEINPGNTTPRWEDGKLMLVTSVQGYDFADYVDESRFDMKAFFALSHGLGK